MMGSNVLVALYQCVKSGNGASPLQINLMNESYFAWAEWKCCEETATFTSLVSRAGAVPPQRHHPVGANAPSSAEARGLKSAMPRAKSGQRQCSDRGPLPRR